MVKVTKFDHHPVQIKKGLFVGNNELEVQALVYAPQTANLVAVTSTDDLVPWRLYNIYTLALAAGITVPEGAVGAVVDVAVNDSGSAANATHMKIATAGVIYASKTFYIYPGNVNDRVGTKQLPIFWTEGGDFTYGVEASGAAFDYTIKIVGWLMAGSGYTYPVMPSLDLGCALRVNQ